MPKLIFIAAIASLIAIPSAFAQPNGSHARTHAGSRHASSRNHHHSLAAHRYAAAGKASRAERDHARQPDEEELAIDELAPAHSTASTASTASAY